MFRALRRSPIPQKLTGFCDKNALRILDLARFIVARMIPRERNARQPRSNRAVAARFPGDDGGALNVYFLAAFARSIAAAISARASAASPQPATLAHFPGSRSL